MSFATFLRNRLLMADFGDWLAELYLTFPVEGLGDVDTTLLYSRHGTVVGSEPITLGDDSISANAAYRKRLVRAPTWTQSLWTQGSILSPRSSSSYGAALFNNRDGGLDQYHPRNGYKWADQRCKVFFGRGRQQAARYLATDVAKTIDARMGRPTFKLSTVEVPLVGHEAQFNQPTSKAVYRGGDYMLELSGVRKVVYGSTPAALDITASLTLSAWLWIEALPTTGVNTWGWLTAPRPWLLIVGALGVLIMRASIGGVSETITSTVALTAKKPYHIAVVVSGRDVTFYVWDEDAQTLTTEEHVDAFSAATRDNVGAGIEYGFQSGGDATFKPWGDEMQVWNTARTADEIASLRHSPLTTVPAACVHYAKMDDGTGTSVTDSSATGANGTISGAGTSTWLHTYEGAAESAGTPKPDLWGQRFGCKPVLVNPVDNGYQINNGGTEEIVNVYAGGLDNYVYDGDAASMRAFIVATVAAGHVLTYLPRGLFRLGSAPTLPLMVTAKGHNDGAAGYVETLGDIMWDIAQQRGPRLDPNTDFDDSSRDDFNSATSSVVGGVFLPAPVDVSDVNDLLARSGAGWWGYLRASTELHVERYTGPAVTADHVFDRRHIIDEPQEIVWQRVGKVVVRYQKSDVVLDEGQVSGSVVGTDGWQRFTQQWLEEQRTDEDADMATARTLVIETALYEQTAAAELADHLRDTLFGEKHGWAVPLMAVGLEVSMNDTLTLAWADANGNTRLGLDGTTKYIALTVSDRRQEGRVDVEALSA